MKNADKIDLYKLDDRLKGQFVKLDKEVNQGVILPINSAHIKGFMNECQTVGLGLSRQLFHINKLRHWVKNLNRDANELTKQDVKDRVRDLIELTDFTEWTKVSHKTTLRLFYQFLEGKDWNNKVWSDRVSWIKLKRPRNEIKRSEFLTPDDIKKILNTCESVRDKALISVLYEGGFRVGELLTTRLKDLEFCKEGVYVTVDGKTGVRRLLLVHANNYLLAWLSIHPSKSDPNSLIWVSTSNTNRGKVITPHGVRKLLRTLSSKAGVSKRVNAHAWRHARACELANKLTEYQLCLYFGWAYGSKMPVTYVHASNGDVINAIKEIHGLVEEKKDNKLSVVKCPRCNQSVNSDARFCDKCGICLNPEGETFFGVKNEPVSPKLIDELKAEITEDILKKLNKTT